jgi:hypothetical protein
MTYASPAWEFAADAHLMKLQRLQNRVLRTIGNHPRRTPVCDLHMAFQIPYVHDYITKLCRQQAEIIQNHCNKNVRNIGQGEANHRKYKRLKLAAVKHTTVQVSRLLWYRKLQKIVHNLLYRVRTDKGLVNTVLRFSILYF